MGSHHCSQAALASKKGHLFLSGSRRDLLMNVWGCLMCSKHIAYLGSLVIYKKCCKKHAARDTSDGWVSLLKWRLWITNVCASSYFLPFVKYHSKYLLKMNNIPYIAPEKSLKVLHIMLNRHRYVFWMQLGNVHFWPFSQ